MASRPEDGRIDWNWPARRIFNLVRGVTHPYPGAFCFANGRKMLIWEARIAEEEGKPAESGRIVRSVGSAIEVATGNGTILLLRSQLEGEPEIEALTALSRANLPIMQRLE